MLDQRRDRRPRGCSAGRIAQANQVGDRRSRSLYTLRQANLYNFCRARAQEPSPLLLVDTPL